MNGPAEAKPSTDATPFQRSFKESLGFLSEVACFLMPLQFVMFLVLKRFEKGKKSYLLRWKYIYWETVYSFS